MLTTAGVRRSAIGATDWGPRDWATALPVSIAAVAPSAIARAKPAQSAARPRLPGGRIAGHHGAISWGANGGEVAERTIDGAFNQHDLEPVFSLSAPHAVSADGHDS